MKQLDRRQHRLLDTFLEKELHRRRMLGISLRTGIGGLLAAHLGPALLGCDDSGGSAKPDAGPDGGATETHLIGIAGGDSATAAAASALALAGGLDFVEPGQSVFLKLASNDGDLYPFSTNPDLLIWIVEQLQAAGAGEIRCGDAPFYGDFGPVFDQNGLQQAADTAGIELRDFRDETDWVSIPQADASAWSASNGIRLPAVMVNSDQIINLPNLKTHFIPGVTLCLKLQIGAVHPDDRSVALSSHSNLHNKIAQINTQFTPSLTVLDGYEACINGGPNPAYGAEAGHVGLAIVSADRIATDVAGIAALRMHTSETGLLNLQSPWDHPTISAAIDHGLGIADAAGFDVGYEDVDDATESTLSEDILG
jgi:uncharacterized protein (DUF362 family)